MDFYFQEKSGFLDAKDRKLFVHWQQDIEVKLSKRLNTEFIEDMSKINNPHLKLLTKNTGDGFLNLSYSDFLKSIFLDLSKLNENNFISSFYKMKAQKNFIKLSQKSEEKVTLAHDAVFNLSQALKYFFGESKKDINLNDEIKQQQLSTQNINLAPGIYVVESGENIRAQKISFSPLSLVKSYGNSFNLEVSVLNNPWIDLSGMNAINISSQRNADKGLPPQLVLNNTIDHNESRPRTLRYNNNGKYSFPNEDWCNYKRRPCLVRFKETFKAGTSPEKQNTGSNGENAGELSIVNLVQLEGNSLIIANGGSGAQGHYGSNSPLCETKGNIINYKPFKNSVRIRRHLCVSATRCSQYSTKIPDNLSPLLKKYMRKIDDLPVEIPYLHVPRGQGGDGGNGGQGGKVYFSNSNPINKKSIIVLGGNAGEGGLPGKCGPHTDFKNDKLHGMAGKSGLIGTVLFQ